MLGISMASSISVGTTQREHACPPGLMTRMHREEKYMIVCVYIHMWLNVSCQHVATNRLVVKRML